MPVYQIYFPDAISSDIEELAKKRGISSKELFREVIGEKIKQMKHEESKKEKRTKKTADSPIKEVMPVIPGENDADN